jgi:hypothetical protein
VHTNKEITDFRLPQWLITDINSVLGLLHSASGQPYAPATLYPPGRFLVLISVRG